jgi:hypothetical protein
MICSGRRPRNGNPTRERGSSGVTAHYISSGCSGISVYSAVGITQSARMGDEPCTEAPSLTLRVTIGADGSQTLAFAGQETRTTIRVTNASFTLRVTNDL